MDDRQLIADLLSALEYHTEQTRPIEFSRVAIEAARDYLRKPAQPRQWQGLTDEGKAELDEKYGDDTLAHLDAIEAKLKEKNT